MTIKYSPLFIAIGAVITLFFIGYLNWKYDTKTTIYQVHEIGLVFLLGTIFGFIYYFFLANVLTKVFHFSFEKSNLLIIINNLSFYLLWLYPFHLTVSHQSINPFIIIFIVISSIFLWVFTLRKFIQELVKKVDKNYIQKLETILSTNKNIKKIEIVTFLITGLIIIYLSAYYFFHAFQSSLFFNGIANNGPFQHFNPLRRIAAGQIPGNEFSVFHGIGWIYAHYPLFLLFGKNLFASEMSRYLMATLSVALSYYLIFRAFLKRQIALYCSLITLLLIHFFKIFWLLDPAGNPYSSLGVRRIIPMATGAFLIYYFRTHPNNGISSKKFIIVFSVLSGLSLFMSYEQGLFTILAALISLLIFYPYPINLRKRIVYVLSYCTLTLLSVFTLFSIGTKGAILKTLSYGLSQITKDQFWYFGVPPNIFVKKFVDFYTYRDLIHPERIIILIFLFASTLYIWLRKKSLRHQLTAILFLEIYGLLSLLPLLGMLSSHYSEPALFVSIVVSINFLVIFSSTIKDWINRKILILKKIHKIKDFFTDKTVIYTVVLLIVFFITFNEHKIELNDPTLLKMYDVSTQVSGVYLGPLWDEYTQNTANVFGASQSKKTEVAINNRTDLYWTHGFFSASSVMVEKAEWLTNIRAHDEIEFAYSGRKEIFAIRNNRILVNGSIDDEKDGYPHTVKIIPYEFTKTNTIVPTTLFLTNEKEDWKNGIRIDKGKSAFMVPKIEDAIEYMSGDMVVFDNGEQRTIKTVVDNKIYLEGAPLSPYLNGYPHEIKFIPCQRELKEVALPISKYSNSEADIQNGIWSPKGIKIKNKDDISAFNIGDYIKFTNNQSRRIIQIYNNTVYFEKKPLNFSNQKYPKTATFIPANNKKTIWSTFSGLLEAEFETFNPSSFDYMIHALGPQYRREYLNKLYETKPDYIVTMRNDYFAYEEWLKNSSWDFYEYVIQNYQLAGYLNHAIIWERKNTFSIIPSRQWEYEETISPETKNIIFEVDPNKVKKDTVMVVEIEYQIQNSLKYLPLIGNTPRYLLIPQNSKSILPISLPPYENTWRFPLILEKGMTHPIITLETSSLIIPADCTLKKVRYRFLDASNETIAAMFKNNYFSLIEDQNDNSK